VPKILATSTGALGRASGTESSPRWAVVLVVVLAALFTAAAAWITYDAADASHTTIDGSTYRYQARIFAMGRLVVPAAPVKSAFAFPHLPTRNGTRSAIFSPGFPAVLAVGAAAGADWLVNPVLAGWVIVGTFLLGRRYFGSSTGVFAAVLVAVSPWLLLHATTFLSHLACTSFLLGTALVVGPGGKRGGWAAFACGLLLGGAALVRMYTGAVYGVLVAALFARGAIRGGAPRTALPAFLLGVTLAGLAQLGWNLETTGSPFVTAYQKAWTEPMFGFGPTTPDRTFLPARSFEEYTPGIALLSVGRQLESLAGKFSPAGAIGLGLPVLGLAWAFWRRNRVALLLAALALAQVFAYALYRKTTGPAAIEMGPRFWFETLPILALLGAIPFAALFRSRAGSVVASCLLATLVTVAVGHSGPEAVRKLEARHDGAKKPNRDLERALAPLSGEPSRLVFVDKRNIDFRAAMLVNRPDLTGNTVVAILGEPSVNLRVIDAFPGYSTWWATANLEEGIRIEPYDPDTFAGVQDPSVGRPTRRGSRRSR
jgi:hypothetical protein